MKTSVEKSPGWQRGIQIGLGVLTVILSVYALAFPTTTFIAVIVILAIILFMIGIEKIISSLSLPSKGRWATIALGILVIIFAGIAISFPVAAAVVVSVLIGIALLFNGLARIIDGLSGKHSGWTKVLLVGVGALSLIIGTLVLVSPLFGTVFVGFIIAIGLFITGIQMITVGAVSRKINSDSSVTV